jgi:molybdenum-dependent DNA-binding transcriptional regulator ModE
MSAVLTERLVEIAKAAREAGHGGKSAVYQAACKELNMSQATLMRKINQVAHREVRKRRSDSGETALTLQEAQLIAAYMRVHTRAMGKLLVKLEDAVTILRSNGEIKAERIEDGTGVIYPLSISTIRRALKNYGLDVETLNAPAPAVELAAKHPNHVWEIDASLCVLYYLPKGGLAVMEAKEFEKNKPGNFKKIEKDRVWRYSVVDKCTGAIYVEYVFGGESGANLAQIFLNSIQPRSQYPFYGVPFMIYVDAGCANTSGMFKNLCRSLSIDLRWHLPGNARATGAVEKSHDIIECKFEGPLKSIGVESLEELNYHANRWMHMFNASAKHSRHGMTRYGAWVKIREEQLRVAPKLALCRELARTAPIERTVTDKLTIDFKGCEYDISHIPDICVKQKVMVCLNPWREGSVQIVRNEEGHDKFYVAEAVNRDDWGYRVDAVKFGDEHKRHADTPAQTQAKLLDKLITGEQTEQGVEAAIKAKKTPFNGRIDPFKPVTDFNIPAYLPRKGTALNVPDLAVPEIKPLDHIELKMRLRAMLGRPVTTEENASLRTWYPEGVMEEALQEVADRLEGKVYDTAPKLVAVN